MTNNKPQNLDELLYQNLYNEGKPVTDKLAMARLLARAMEAYYKPQLEELRAIAVKLTSELVNLKTDYKSMAEGAREEIAKKMSRLNETKKLHCSHSEIVQNPDNCPAQSCDGACVAFRRVSAPIVDDNYKLSLWLTLKDFIERIKIKRKG